MGRSHRDHPAFSASPGFHVAVGASLPRYVSIHNLDEPCSNTSCFPLAFYSPLSLEAPFQHVAAVLRVSSPEQLDLPNVHSLAKSYFVAMFPSGPSPFVHPDHLEEALSLALRYNITSVCLSLLQASASREMLTQQRADPKGHLLQPCDHDRFRVQLRHCPRKYSTPQRDRPGTHRH